MNSYQKYVAAVREAEQVELKARAAVEEDINKMQDILREHISAALNEIRNEVGWAPPSISVDMIDASCYSEPDNFVLGSVSVSI